MWKLRPKNSRGMRASTGPDTGREIVKRFVLCFLVLLIAAISPAALTAQTQSAAPAAKSSTTHAHSAAHRTDPALYHPAALTAKAPDEYEVTFKTTAGDFVVQVTRAWAPQGADRFYNLVKHGYFTDAAFFRVVPGFIVQFGLNANPAINKVWEKAAIKDDMVTQSNKLGYLSYAAAGPGTRTTQIFINLADNGSSLDNRPDHFAPFGHVISGMDVVQKIYSGYGESPDQGSITTEGKAYLDKNFPKLDHIISATVTSPAPEVHHAPAHKTAAPPAKNP
jgi:peptidyl-prolyl cis-trans isomerase A (cyclophilin A)